MTFLTPYRNTLLRYLLTALMSFAVRAPANSSVDLRLLDSNIIHTPLAVSFESPLLFDFDSPLACSLVKPTWIKVFDTTTEIPVPGRLICESNRLFFVPAMQLSWYTNNHSQMPAAKSWQGLRAGHFYRAELSSDIATEDASVKFASMMFEFAMEPVDYGTIWFNADGLGERQFKNIKNPFIVTKSPTIVIIQGRQELAVKDGMYRNNPFLKEFWNVQSENLLTAWKARGFNTGVLFWEQFSDESEPKAIEAKLWSVPSLHSPGIPYLNAFAKRAFLKSKAHLADLLCNNYMESIRNIEPSDLRVIGHSVGTQVAIHCAWRSINSYPNIPPPNRIVLLDSFWGKGARSFLGNIWIGAVSTTELSEVIAHSQPAVEQYKSSPLGGLVGDSNLPIRKHTAFVRLWPNFLHGWAVGGRHNFSLSWYLESILAPVPVRNNDASLGAAASDSSVQQLSNKPSAPMHLFSVMSGSVTSSPSDDVLEMDPGVTTW